jgi:hypothetical protein
MNTTILLSAVLLAATVSAADIPTPEVQIASSILAAPTELREGKNELICLATDPGKPRFSAACYHRDLEAYMARGRELAAQKVAGEKSHEIRWKEIADGKLSMPREPRTLYVLTGTGFDASSGKVTDAYLRWVIYIPYATPESTGLSTKASDSAPWLMYPGKAGAHVMISPPKNK